MRREGRAARRAVGLVAAVMAAAGCALGGTPTTPGPKKPVASKVSASATPAPALSRVDPSAKPLPTGAPLSTPLARPIAQTGVAATLTGKAKLLSDHGGGVISNNAGSLVSNNSGSLVSDQGGGLVANNGGGVIANNGGGLVSKSKYGLAQATPGAPAASAALSEALLADATIEVYDAAGRRLVDEAGKPLSATTDATGSYTLRAVLPPEGLVLRANLGVGGQLQAMVAKDAVTTEASASGPVALDLDTASSIGAAYVLREFVASQPNPQAVLDKLPASEAARLKATIAAANPTMAGLATVSYDAEALATLAASWRKQSPALDDALDDIKALLLGQANLGDGALATAVALTGVRYALRDADGSLLIAETTFGRIRRVDREGHISTLADAKQGVIKQNFFDLRDMVRAPDGTLYVAAATERAVYAIAPDKTVTAIAALAGHPAYALARAADGALYVGEQHNPSNGLPLVTTLPPGGPARALPVEATWNGSDVVGIAVGADGTVYAYVRFDSQTRGAVYRLPPGAAAWSLVVGDLLTGKDGDVYALPDGGLIVTEDRAPRVLHLSASGERSVLAGLGSTAGTGSWSRPAGIDREADGTLIIADPGTGQVVALAPDGSMKVLAGLGQAAQAQRDDAIAINSPGGVTFDAEGRLIFSESGSHTLRRFDGKEGVTIAGAAQGDGGDEGPAKWAGFNVPTAVAMRDGVLWVVDAGNKRLRRITADGVIHGAVRGDNPPVFGAGPVLAANFCRVKGTAGLTLDAQGRPIWSSGEYHQIIRLAADGKTVELLAGSPAAQPGDEGDGGPARDARFNAVFGVTFGPDGALYLADSMNMRIRRIVGLDGPSPTVESFAGLNTPETLARLDDGRLAKQDGLDRREAAIFLPGGLCFDQAGNMYVGEMGSTQWPLIASQAPTVFGLGLGDRPVAPARIRRIAPDGKVTTVAGPGGKFFTDPLAQDALVLPTTLAIDPQGRLVIADTGANVIRLLPAGSY